LLDNDSSFEARGMRGAAALALAGMAADRRADDREIGLGTTSEEEVKAPIGQKPQKKRKRRTVSTPTEDDDDEDYDGEYETGLRRLRFKTPQSIRRRLSDSRRALEAVGNSPFGRATMAFIEANGDRMTSHLSTIRSEGRKHQVRFLVSNLSILNPTLIVWQFALNCTLCPSMQSVLAGRLQAISSQLDHINTFVQMTAAGEDPISVKAAWMADLKLPWESTEDMW
jgi:hypothetical protein